MRALFVGRFQPFHWGHFKAVRWILERETGLIIVVAAAQFSHTLRNPFTAGERVEMIHNTLRLYLPDADVVVIPVVDIEDNALRVKHLERMLPPFRVVYSNNPLVRQLFKEEGYEVRSIPLFNRRIRSAKHIRELLVKNDPSWTGLVPGPVAEVIMRVIDRFRIFRESDEAERSFSVEALERMFIVLEGVDKSGKDSVIIELARLIRNYKRVDIVITREPTYRIKAIIGEFEDKIALRYLFLADRIENAKRVRRLLDEGKIVIQSRTFVSTLVYQDDDWEGILKLHEYPLSIARPDYIFVLDVDPSVIFSRLDNPDRFEGKHVVNKINELRERYLKAVEWLSNKGFRVFVVDANCKSPEEIASDIFEYIKNDLRLSRSTETRSRNSFGEG